VPSCEKTAFFMEYYVYIIYSEFFDKYYKGYTRCPLLRLREHNEGRSSYTSSYKPWRLVYLERFSSKREALIRERGIKKFGKAQLRRLISSAKNLLNTPDFELQCRCLVKK